MEQHTQPERQVLEAVNPEEALVRFDPPERFRRPYWFPFFQQHSEVSMEAQIEKQHDYTEAVQQTLQRAPALLIDGEWTGSQTGHCLDVVDPSSKEKMSEICDAGAADVDLAVKAARNAFDDGRWTGLPPLAREQMILRLADLLEQNSAELAELESIDSGKPSAITAAVDIPLSIAILRGLGSWATKLNGEVVQPMLMPNGAFHTYLKRQPLGVAGLIVPWNFPLVLAVTKLAPALAAGCTVVLKPAEQTPLSVLRLGDLILEAGFPAGVVNIITGLGQTAGDALVRHPDVDKISFTGSTITGKTINRVATETLKRVTLELGGKSPVVVFPDVDVAEVAPHVANGIFFNTGQVCVAGSRLFAHSSIYDKLLEALSEHAQNLRLGPSLSMQTQLGPVVSDVQLDRVMGYIDQGKKDGASVVVGGNAPAGHGYYVEPTILAEVTPQMSVVKEEIFGPVLAVQRFDDIDEAIKRANDSPYGLAASVWTNDVKTMHRMLAGIHSGSVWGNCGGLLDPGVAVGGFKQSGFGQEMGRHGVEAYTELKSVVLAVQ